MNTFYLKLKISFKYMNTFYLDKSPLSTKKWRVIFPNKKHIDFGAKGYEDYTIHHDEERKKRYIQRHQKNEDWNDIFSRGAWSRFLLWEYKNLGSAIKNIEKKFNINIVPLIK